MEQIDPYGPQEQKRSRHQRRLAKWDPDISRHDLQRLSQLFHGLHTTWYVHKPLPLSKSTQHLVPLSPFYTHKPPPAPTALSNGPTIIEMQCDFILSALQKLEDEGIVSIEPNTDAEDEWDNMIDAMNQHTLFPLTNSWWNAANVPGKRVQILTHPGGIQMYEGQCRGMLEGWKGFTVVKGEGGKGKEKGEALKEGDEVEEKDVVGVVGNGHVVSNGVEV